MLWKRKALIFREKILTLILIQNVSGYNKLNQGPKQSFLSKITFEKIFHTQQQSLCQLVPTRMNRKCNIALYWNQKTSTSFHFSIKSIPLPEVVQRRFCFCFKLILSIGSVKLFLNVTMAMNWKKFHLISDYSLFNLLVKNGFGAKISYKLYFFMGRKAVFHFFVWRKAFCRIMNCCFIFGFGSNRWEFLCKSRCTTKNYSKM